MHILYVNFYIGIIWVVCHLLINFRFIQIFSITHCNYYITLQIHKILHKSLWYNLHNTFTYACMAMQEVIYFCLEFKLRNWLILSWYLEWSSPVIIWVSHGIFAKFYTGAHLCKQQLHYATAQSQYHTSSQFCLIKFCGPSIKRLLNVL